MPFSPELHQQIDRCVMCGMCSEHCPTYHLTQNENESPRGRLHLISLLNQGDLQPDAKLFDHLDHCLGCRACEHTCPSLVAYGAIMDQARALLEPQRPLSQRLPKKFRHWLLSHRRLLRSTLGALSLAQGSGLLNLPGFKQLGHKLPPLETTPKLHSYYPPQGEKKAGDVALFLGCINENLGQKGLAAAIHILNRLDYGIHVPSRQTCCGALYQHNGNPEQATHLARRNLDAFAGLKIDAILHTASACTAMLQDYQQLKGLTDMQRRSATQFSGQAMDINHFLANLIWPAEITIQPLTQRVAVHSPCSLSHVLRQTDAPFRLLRHIPQIELVTLPGNSYCCGGAGDYPLTQPDWARHLGDETLAALEKLGADILVTSNIGCLSHLGDRLRERGRSLEILHPVELLARQLR